MRLFHITFGNISPTPSAKLESEISPTLSAKLQPVSSNDFTTIQSISAVFPLPWSHYVKLLSVDDEKARKFYEEEALRGGWSVRQLDRQIGSKFTHADAGQMHMYLNYAAEHWTHGGENPPVGLTLCAEKDAAVAHYSLEGLPNKVMASEYKLALPDEKLLEEELQHTKRAIESRKPKTDN